MKKVFQIMLTFLLAALAIGLSATTVAAHERRDVGKYQLVVGFIVEPAFEGQKNGIDLRVTDNSSGTTVNVEGLEQTLKVEITHVPTGVSKVFDLRTIFRDPGHYTADLLPTDAGIYRMRFFGTINGLAVDETFNSRSGGGNFGDVESSADIQFPTRVAEVREVEAVARHVEDEQHETLEQASKAGTMAIVGIALGAIGTAVGLFSVAASRRKAK